MNVRRPVPTLNAQVRTRLAYSTEGGKVWSAAEARGAQGSRWGRASSRALQQGSRASIKDMLQSIVQREGVRGLYHGIGPTLCGIVPYAGLKFYVYQVRSKHDE